ncbi:MAG: hypothetical protein ACOX88_08530 [Christensenellales bacterium]
MNIKPDVLDILDSVFFISKAMIQKETNALESQNVVGGQDAEQVFAKGYAGKRNAILYYALKQKIDYLIFLDDDEYPLAVTRARGIPLWSGQDVFANHLEHLKDADITNGYHCGYISPIPYIHFNDIISENDFRLFIEAISNDILEWDTIKRTMDNGGVTYADPQVFIDNTAKEVQEVNRAKFISGSNLGINLIAPQRVKPFFNPPNARGEDTFLSTCLSGHKVLRIPSYTFHDGFSVYNDLLDGVLPLEMKHINADNEKIVMRFYRACIGWIRYKPLYLFITRTEDFDREMEAVREKLAVTLPKLCEYFDMPRFRNIALEFERYRKAVPRHYELFMQNQRIWEQIRTYASEQTF